MNTRSPARHTAALLLGVVAILLLWRLADVLLLLFAGLLIAVFLLRLTEILRKYVTLPHIPALMLVLLLLTSLFVLFIAQAAPSIAVQTARLIQLVPQGLERLQEFAATFGFGWEAIDLDAYEEWAQRAADVLGIATNAVVIFFGGLTAALLCLLIGVFIAISPKAYVDGFIALFPDARKARMRAVLHEVGKTLWLWVVSRILSMLVVGILTVIGLRIIGLPLALTLSIFAGLMSFVPNFGPLIAIVPAMLIAVLEGPQYLIYVPVVYAIVQLLETNIITPVLQQKIIALPAGLVIAAQIVAAALFGFVGLLLATPLAAAVIVLVRMLYVEDVVKKSG